MALPWTDIKNINNKDNYIGSQTSFSQVLDFGNYEEKWFRGFKLHMKIPLVSNRIGIYSLEAFSA